MLTVNDNNTSLLMTCYQQQNKTQTGANIAPHLLQASCLTIVLIKLVYWHYVNIKIIIYFGWFLEVDNGLEDIYIYISFNFQSIFRGPWSGKIAFYKIAGLQFSLETLKDLNMRHLQTQHTAHNTKYMNYIIFYHNYIKHYTYCVKYLIPDMTTLPLNL